MTIADMIYQQVQTMPDALAQEVLDESGISQNKMEKRFQNHVNRN
jgi:hypothetical protein